MSETVTIRPVRCDGDNPFPSNPGCLKEIHLSFVNGVRRAVAVYLEQSRNPYAPLQRLSQATYEITCNPDRDTYCYNGVRSNRETVRLILETWGSYLRVSDAQRMAEHLGLESDEDPLSTDFMENCG